MRLLLVVCVLALSVTPAAAARLQIDRNACKMLTVHKPLPDVSYQEGVDSRGNPVVPADINPGVKIGETFTIPVTIDIGEQFGIPMGLVDGTEAMVAVINVDGDKIYLDGQPLSPEQEDNLAVLCLDDDEQ